ncbi:hypothetical protein L9F63_023775 [Diploptera punctata]|uniref:CHK kinase-like domain-containing protein n=1 Tax=Diploptera punctata TaxID=6984 RepID=A0AAD8E8P9_DIPPU|nr:hypothetical protein L9F63_023775 [Diploptera punctata]
MSKEPTETEHDIPSWLNDAFLETALKSEDVHGDLKVTSCKIVRATSPGDNYLSLIYRATVQTTTRGRSESRSLIIKCQPQEGFLKEMTNKYRFFELEAEMLKDVLPAMHKLLEEANIENFSPFCAKHLYSRFGPPAQVIVLEDLKESGFQMAERTAGLDREHCMIVMNKIAQFHAASLVLKQRNPQLLEAFLNPCTNDMLVNEFDFFESYMSDLCDEINTRCEYLKEYIGKIRMIGERGAKRFTEGKSRREGEFCVLAHADLWVNNMMFRYVKESRQLTDMRFVDYQLSLWTSPTVDLLYFLNSSPAMDLLEDQTEFIERYHRVLGETLCALGYQHLHITLEHLNELLESRGYFGMLSVFSIRNVVLSDDESRINLDDLSPEGKKKFKFGKMYLESLKLQIPLLEERGWLV